MLGAANIAAIPAATPGNILYITEFEKADYLQVN